MALSRVDRLGLPRQLRSTRPNFRESQKVVAVSIQKLRIGDLKLLKIDPKTGRVSNRESEHREFKLKFDAKSVAKYARTMASFANRDGGVIFFGIKDRPRELVGISEKDVPDDVILTNFLKEYFQPEIAFESEVVDINDVRLYCLTIKSSPYRPVICKKSKSLRAEQGEPEKEILREGAIYYRYSSSSDEIKYADLDIMLRNEREKYFKSMIDNITLINKVGVERAAIIDSSDLSGNGGSASVFLTSEAARNLNWIDSGRFVEDESDGDRAYYVVRRVEIRHGIEIPKPTDFAKTHPLTKTELQKGVKIGNNEFDAVIWKLGIKDNPRYHISSHHGKNNIHKFTLESRLIILKQFPLDLLNRQELIKSILEEYKGAVRA